MVLRTSVRVTNAYSAVRKYQFMEANMQRRAAGLKDKMPDIQKTLETVQFLKTRMVGCGGSDHKLIYLLKLF